VLNHKETSRQAQSPASVSFPTREAQAFPSAPSNRARQTRRNSRPRRQKVTQATGIGNSILIIDAGAEPRDPVSEEVKGQIAEVRTHRFGSFYLCNLTSHP